MTALAYGGCEDVTSGRIAMSVNTSASFVRRVLAKLSKAGLIQTSKGKGGSCRLAKEPKKISLLDIYVAVDPPKVFSIHTYEAQGPCAVSCQIKKSLEKVLVKSQQAVERSLKQFTLAEIASDIGKA